MQPPPRALYLLDRKAVLPGSNLTEGEILIISTQYESIILYYFWFQYLYGFSQVKVSVDEFFVAGEKSYDSLSYTWDAVAEFPEKTQEELYSITKMFISNYWVSAQDVIQNDDKENGMLVVKGVASVDVSQSGYFYTYDYAYTVTFMQKEGRCRIKISRLYCERSVYELFGMSRECPRVELWDIDAKTMRVGLVKQGRVKLINKAISLIGNTVSSYFMIDGSKSQNGTLDCIFGKSSTACGKIAFRLVLCRGIVIS